jgi:hypothetical protein
MKDSIGTSTTVTVATGARLCGCYPDTIYEGICKGDLRTAPKSDDDRVRVFVGDLVSYLREFHGIDSRELAKTVWVK